MDPRLSDEAFLGRLHRSPIKLKGPHEENDDKELETGPFTCDISKSIAQHKIPSLLALLDKATATQFQIIRPPPLLTVGRQ